MRMTMGASLCFGAPTISSADARRLPDRPDPTPECARQPGALISLGIDNDSRASKRGSAAAAN